MYNIKEMVPDYVPLQRSDYLYALKKLLQYYGGKSWFLFVMN